MGRAARLCIALIAGSLAVGCSGNYAAEEAVGPKPGPKGKYNPAYEEPSVFGSGGLSFGNVGSGSALNPFGGGDEKARLPVNKYLWQGALDTLSFLPLASSDPFTGVIATDWGSTPEAPGERLKVTAYILNPGLTAAALKVAVYRQVLSDAGVWVPAPVSADSGRELEDAILNRARQIRFAGLEDGNAG